MSNRTRRNLVAITSSLAGALLLFSGIVNLGFALNGFPSHARTINIILSAFTVFYGMGMYMVWMNGITVFGSKFDEYRRIFMLLSKYRDKIEWRFREDIAGIEGVYKIWNFRILLPGDWNDWGWRFEARRMGHEGVATYWARNGSLDEEMRDLIDDLFIRLQMAQGSWNVQHYDPVFKNLKKSLKQKKAA